MKRGWAIGAGIGGGLLLLLGVAYATRKVAPPSDVKETGMKWQDGQWWAVNAAGTRVEPMYNPPGAPAPGSAEAGGKVVPIRHGAAGPYKPNVQVWVGGVWYMTDAMGYVGQPMSPQPPAPATPDAQRAALYGAMVNPPTAASAIPSAPASPTAALPAVPSAPASPMAALPAASGALQQLPSIGSVAGAFGGGSGVGGDGGASDLAGAFGGG